MDATALPGPAEGTVVGTAASEPAPSPPSPPGLPAERDMVKPPSSAPSVRETLLPLPTADAGLAAPGDTLQLTRCLGSDSRCQEQADTRAGLRKGPQAGPEGRVPGGTGPVGKLCQESGPGGWARSGHGTETGTATLQPDGANPRGQWGLVVASGKALTSAGRSGAGQLHDERPPKAPAHRQLPSRPPEGAQSSERRCALSQQGTLVGPGTSCHISGFRRYGPRGHSSSPTATTTAPRG